MRGAVLLDRDGTLIVEQDYLDDPKRVVLEAGVVAGLQDLQAAGWPLVVLTNQSGVGRGYFDLAAANRVNARVADLLAAEGIAIAGWYLCPHTPSDHCDCRKPAPGLARQAAADLFLALDRSWVVGDKISDVDLAVAIGARGILVLTGHGGLATTLPQGAAVVTCADLTEASHHILASAISPCRAN